MTGPYVPSEDERRVIAKLEAVRIKAAEDAVIALRQPRTPPMKREDIVEAAREAIANCAPDPDKPYGYTEAQAALAALEALGLVRTWQGIETLPEKTDALVCCTHDLGEDETETVMWTDWHYTDEKGGKRWFSYPSLIHVPFPPTHWMPLPLAPIQDGEG